MKRFHFYRKAFLFLFLGVLFLSFQTSNKLKAQTLDSTEIYKAILFVGYLNDGNVQDTLIGTAKADGIFRPRFIKWGQGGAPNGIPSEKKFAITQITYPNWSSLRVTCNLEKANADTMTDLTIIMWGKLMNPDSTYRDTTVALVVFGQKGLDTSSTINLSQVQPFQIQPFVAMNMRMGTEFTNGQFRDLSNIPSYERPVIPVNTDTVPPPPPITLGPIYVQRPYPDTFSDLVVYIPITSHSENRSYLSRVVYEKQVLSNGNWIWQTMYDGSPESHYLGSMNTYYFGSQNAEYDQSVNMGRLHVRTTFYTNYGYGDIPLQPVLEKDTLVDPPPPPPIGITDLYVERPDESSACGLNVNIPLSNPENYSYVTRIVLEKVVYVGGYWSWQTVFDGNPYSYFNYSRNMFQFNNECAIYDESVNMCRSHYMATLYETNGYTESMVYPTLEKDTLMTNPPQPPIGLGDIALDPPPAGDTCHINVKIPVANPENVSYLNRVVFEKQTYDGSSWSWTTVYDGDPSSYFSSNMYVFSNQCAVYDPVQSKYRLHVRATFYMNYGYGDQQVATIPEKDTLYAPPPPPSCCSQTPIQYTQSGCQYTFKYFSLSGCTSVYGIKKILNGGSPTTLMYDPNNPIVAPSGMVIDVIQVPPGQTVTVVYNLLKQSGTKLCNTETFTLNCGGSIQNPGSGVDKDLISGQKLVCYAVPNPATDETDIYYNVTGDLGADVSIDLFGAIGNQIMQIYNGHSNPGLNRVKLNAEGLVSGAYFVRVTIGRDMATFPIMIIK